MTDVSLKMAPMGPCWCERYLVSRINIVSTSILLVLMSAQYENYSSRMFCQAKSLWYELTTVDIDTGFNKTPQRRAKSDKEGSFHSDGSQNPSRGFTISEVLFFFYRERKRNMAQQYPNQTYLNWWSQCPPHVQPSLIQSRTQTTPKTITWTARPTTILLGWKALIFWQTLYWMCLQLKCSATRSK